MPVSPKVLDSVSRSFLLHKQGCANARVVSFLGICVFSSWLQAAEPAAPQPQPKSIKEASTEVLIERKNAITQEMRRLDSEFQLIPFRFRELEQQVREIDEEISKRGGKK